MTMMLATTEVEDLARDLFKSLPGQMVTIYQPIEQRWRITLPEHDTRWSSSREAQALDRLAQRADTRMADTGAIDDVGHWKDTR